MEGTALVLWNNGTEPEDNQTVKRYSLEDSTQIIFPSKRHTSVNVISGILLCPFLAPSGVNGTFTTESSSQNAPIQQQQQGKPIWAFLILSLSCKLTEDNCCYFGCSFYLWNHYHPPYFTIGLDNGSETETGSKEGATDVQI